MYESGCSRLCEFTYGRPKKPLEIADSGWEKMSMIASPKSAQAMAMRARIVVGCGQGESNSGGLDAPRVGAPRKITHKQIEDVITRHWNRWQPTHPLKQAPDGRRSGLTKKARRTVGLGGLNPPIV